VKVRREEVREVIEKLKEMGGKVEEPPEGVEARLRFKEGVVHVYSTGSITVGGKERERLKEKVGRAISEGIERELPIVGCDEAGKGEFFGPLVVACVHADERCYGELLKLGLKDSKKLKPEKILELSERIKRVCSGRVRVLMPEEYNELYRKYGNQNRLMEEVYLGVLKKLFEKKGFPKKVVVDRFSLKVEEVLKKEFPEVEFEVKTRGEEEPVVAAAAVVAKAERLKRLAELSKELGFEVKEGNAEVGELLRKIPREKLRKFVKEHFSVKEQR